MRPSILSIFALAAVCFVSLAGCKKSLDSQVVGKWEGKMTMTAEQEKNPMAKMMESMMKMSLDVKPDKTFSMTVAMLPFEGNWDTSSDKLNLHVTKVMGMDKAALTAQAEKAKGKDFKASDMDKFDKPMVLSLAGDGKSMTVDDKGVMSAKEGAPDGAISFTKTAEPAK